MKRLYLILAVAAGIGLLAGVQASNAAENAISVSCDPCRADQEITVTYTADRVSAGSMVLMRVSHEGAEMHLEKVPVGHTNGVFTHTFQPDQQHRWHTHPATGEYVVRVNSVQKTFDIAPAPDPTYTALWRIDAR